MISYTKTLTYLYSLSIALTTMLSTGLAYSEEKLSKNILNKRYKTIETTHKYMHSNKPTIEIERYLIKDNVFLVYCSKYSYNSLGHIVKAIKWKENTQSNIDSNLCITPSKNSKDYLETIYKKLADGSYYTTAYNYYFRDKIRPDCKTLTYDNNGDIIKEIQYRLTSAEDDCSDLFKIKRRAISYSTSEIDLDPTTSFLRMHSLEDNELFSTKHSIIYFRLALLHTARPFHYPASLGL